MLLDKGGCVGFRSGGLAAEGAVALVEVREIAFDFELDFCAEALAFHSLFLVNVESSPIGTNYGWLFRGVGAVK